MRFEKRRRKRKLITSRFHYVAIPSHLGIRRSPCFHNNCNQNTRKKHVFGDFDPHNLLLYPKLCFMGQKLVSCYPMISPMVPLILMTPYSHSMGHDSDSFVTKDGQKLLKNMFLASFTSITSYSTHTIVLWANE